MTEGEDWLEPVARSWFDNDSMLLASIAVSLKRMADSMERQELDKDRPHA